MTPRLSGVFRDALNNLGGVLQAMGDIPKARQPYEADSLMLQNVLGSDHPMTKNVEENLASLEGPGLAPED